MMNQNQVKHVPAGTGQIYWGPGDRVTFLITGAETGGAFFMAAVSVPPGGGPPPHIHHREDESFYLQQGTLIIPLARRSSTHRLAILFTSLAGLCISFRTQRRSTRGC
jgi:quercetin dioxygenase-like cupin family protein